MNQQQYDFLPYTGAEAANTPELVKAISFVFSHSFGINPKTKEPYKLGPKKTKERLQSTGYLFVSHLNKASIVGYLYGRVIEITNGRVGWIDSLAVLPDHRRKGVGSNLVRQFNLKLSDCRWFGCATPNPIAALVVSKVIEGRLFVDRCNPPEEVITMINDIRPRCPDLRGASFNPTELRIKTDFTPISSEETLDWNPPQPSEPPPWWSSLKNLPNRYEALLIIDSRETSSKDDWRI